MRAGAYILIDEVEAAITRHEGCNLLAVLDKLSTHALTDSRVGLLGLDAAAQKKHERVSVWPLTQTTENAGAGASGC